MKFFSKYKFEVWVFIGAAAFTLASFFNSALRYASDDQFITYRYIDNIAKGNGFVYNLGEKVLGSSAPLFALIMAALKYVFRGVYTPDLVAYANIFLFCASAVFFYRIARYLIGNKWGLFAVLIYILNMGKMIPQGMETILFLLLLFIVFDLLLSHKFWWSSFFLSMLLLTRLDGILVALIVFIFWRQKEGFLKAIKLTAVVIITALPWIIFATWYFGSPIPQSVITKLHVNDIVNQSTLQAFKVQLSSISKIYWGNIFDPNNILAQVFTNLLPVCLLVFAWVTKRLNNDNWIFFGVPLAYFVSYSLSNPVMFSWYVSQIEPSWILISFAGAVSLIEDIKKPIFIICCIAVLLVGPIVRWFNLATHNEEGKIESFIRTAQQIKSVIRPEERVMVNNFGAIGFVTERYIIDPFGLINPDAARFYPIMDTCVDKSLQYAYPPQMIEEMKPEWLLITRKELLNCFSSDWIDLNYKPFTIEGKVVDDIWLLKK